MESTTFEKTMDSFESDLIEQDFIKTLCNGVPEYIIDHDSDHNGPFAWIEFKNVRNEAIIELEKDYDIFAMPFELWANKNELISPEILGGENNCILFKVYF